VPTITKGGKFIINYFACPKFANMNPQERLSQLNRKKLCFQCLTPGAKKGHYGNCYNTFNCPDGSHKTFDIGYHVLVCNRHKNDPQNQKLLEEYKSRYISDSLHKNFSKNLSIAFHVNPDVKKSYGSQSKSSNEENLDLAIYMLQTIEIQGEKFNLFYDTGCSDLVAKKDAITTLEKMGRATNIYSGVLTLSGVGDNQTSCEHGLYSVKLPLHDGREVHLSGICLDKITSKFPKYPLKEVEDDIHRAFRAQSSKNDPKRLPKLPHSVGGETDLMIGIQFLKYYPKKIFSLPNGLTLYESQFLNSDGSKGLVGGPHRIFSEIQRNFQGNHVSTSAYVTQMANSYREGYERN